MQDEADMVVERPDNEPVGSTSRSFPSSADELALAKRLMGFDSSHHDGIKAVTGFLTGWLDAHDIAYTTFDVAGLPCLVASVGEGPVTIVLHAHIDVVPGSEGQFIPWEHEGNLWGRGAYDMKGATAAMLAVMADLKALPEELPIRVRFVLVPDEESDEIQDEYGTEQVVERGFIGDFVICGEPTDLHVGIQAKGVLGVRIEVDGKSAHGATPWLGVNAIAKAMDIFDELLKLPFAQESSRFYDRPSINLARVNAGGRLNTVPEKCTMDVDIRFLPGQTVERVREELRSLPGCTLKELIWRPPAKVSTENPFLQRLRESIDTVVTDRVCGVVGRDGTNDGIHFLKVGIPSVEFGPVGGGHHGPEEWVSIRSLQRYREALLEFLRKVAADVDVLEGVTIRTPRGRRGEEPRSLL